MKKLLHFSKPHLFKCAFTRHFHSSKISFTQTPLCVLTETEEMIRDQVRNFAKEVIQPKVREMDEKEQMDKDIIKACFDQGLMGIEIPEEYGGSNMSFMSSIIVIEELARIDPAVSVMVDVHNTLINTIMMKYGTKEQKEKWLPKLATDTIGSFCLSEATSGSDAFALKCSAEDKGDHFILNGTKQWITNANEAGLFLVMATVDKSLGYKGITAFLVDRNNPGLEIGKKEKKLGIRASSTCEVILNNCKVDKKDVIGEIGKGYKIAISTLNEGRIGIGGQMVGLAQGTYDYTIPYLQQRTQFGKPVADFQGMMFDYAKSACDIHAARLMVYEAARMREYGLQFQKEAAMAKYYASQVAKEVSAKCIEWFGGVGFTREFMAEKFYRDAIIGTIYEGTSNMNLQTIAKLVQEYYKNLNV